MDSAKSLRFAKVKPISSKTKEEDIVIPIDSIVEFQKNLPKNNHDYDSKKIYTAKFKAPDTSEVQMRPVKIGGLCCEYCIFLHLMFKVPNERMLRQDVPKHLLSSLTDAVYSYYYIFMSTNR